MLLLWIVDAQVPALFYTKQELGLRLAYWFGFAAVAGAFGGLLAFGVQHASVGFANWRLLFIVEVCHPCGPIASRTRVVINRELRLSSLA